MSSEWIGSLISIECGDVLGTYQGKVIYVDQASQNLTIEKAYRNGTQCKVPTVTINAADIKDLQFINTNNNKPEQTNGNTNGNEVQIEGRRKNGHKEPKRGTPVEFRSSPNNVQKNSPRGSPTKNTRHNHSNGSHKNGYNHRSTPPFIDEPGPTSRRRTNSASASDKKRMTTPKKIEQNHRRRKEDLTFSAPSDSYMDEFDFEKNLAMFDKKAVFEEIENGGNGPLVIQATQYKNDENVLQSAPVAFRQIKVKTPTGIAKEYVTDCGLIVPCVPYDMRTQIFSTSEKYGLSQERQLEMIGRSAGEMVLTLLGGSSRLNPQNAHQKPSVVVLCGPHFQGAQGVNCARQIAAHNVKVNVFVPNFVKMLPLLRTEIQLFELTGGTKVSNISELPTGPVDIIINALDSHDQNNLAHQQWYQQIVAWTTQRKAQVLALDPPVDCGSIAPKWSLSLGLPLSLSEKCGQVYLCDLGIPKNVFKEVGISYRSPFGHKFVIPLHPSASTSS